MNVKPCPVRGCESLIRVTRPACFGHLMTLPSETRAELFRLAKRAPGSEALRTARANALAYLDGLQPRRQGRAS